MAEIQQRFEQGENTFNTDENKWPSWQLLVAGAARGKLSENLLSSESAPHRKLQLKAEEEKNRRKSFPMKIKRPRRFIHIQPRIVIVCGNSRITRREKKTTENLTDQEEKVPRQTLRFRGFRFTLKYAKATIPDFNFALAENVSH